MTSTLFSKRLPSVTPEHSVRALFGDPREESEHQSGRNKSGIVDLTHTNPTTAGFDYPEHELRLALGGEGVARYEPHPLGLPSARAALARDWLERGHSVGLEDIVITASTSEAYALAFKLFCDPGDEVLVPEPSYPLFDVLARLEGVRAVGYRLAYDGAWHIDMDSLRRARTARTRAVILVSPNNPTGSLVTSSEFAACSELGLPLVVDEVFWPYVWVGRAGESNSAHALRRSSTDVPLVLTLDGLSKRAGMPQLKLGWITLGGDAGLVRQTRERLELINDSYLSANTPAQLALAELLRLGVPVQQQIATRCLTNLASLSRVFDGSAAQALSLEGGWSACLRLPATYSDEEWVLSLYTEAQLLTQPGWFYDFSGGSYLVVSLLTHPELFSEGMRVLREHVERKL